MFGLYTAAMILLHPTFLYPFDQTPFDHPGYYATGVGHTGPIVYVHDAGQASPVILYFMGNVGAVQAFLPMLEAHRKEGRSVVAMAYRGGGSVPGKVSEYRLKADALAAHDALPMLLKEPPEIVVVQGYSLGTGLAVHVAANREVDGVILSAPYDKICRLMARSSGLPACRLPAVQKWETDLDAPRVTAPVLALHGAQDDLIPIAFGKALFESFPHSSLDNTSFVEIPGAGHNDLLQFPSYLTAIHAFVRGL